MKIGVLGTRGFPGVQGGIEKHCEGLYPRLAEQGENITVFSRAPYTGKEEYVYKNVLVKPVVCPKNKFLETIIHTFIGILVARYNNINILHIHAIGPSLFVPFAKMLGFKVVVTHHGHDYDRKKWNIFAKMLLKFGEKLAVKYADEVITVSNAIKLNIHQRYDQDTIFIPNGVEVKEPTKSNNILKKFGLESNMYILSVGRLVPEKCFDLLVESFSKLDQWERNYYKLVIVGDCDHEDNFSLKLKSICKNTPDVIMTGFQPSEVLDELYSNAATFILPSTHEGLPFVLLEALSYGVSCIASDIPSNREVALDQDRYFQAGNIGQMSQKIKLYCNTPTTVDQREFSRNSIRDKYNWSNIVNETRLVLA